MSNPMFDKAQEKAKGLKDKFKGKGRPEDREPGVPGDDIEQMRDRADEDPGAPVPPEQQRPPQ
jgi:hypothetical protein